MPGVTHESVTSPPIGHASLEPWSPERQTLRCSEHHGDSGCAELTWTCPHRPHISTAWPPLLIPQSGPAPQRHQGEAEPGTCQISAYAQHMSHVTDMEVTSETHVQVPQGCNPSPGLYT